MMAGVVASETVRAQTLQVSIHLWIDTADRPMLVWGCDITRDQVIVLDLSSPVICDHQLSLNE